MKIFVVHNNFTPLEGNKSMSSTLLSNTPAVYELPDTALLLNHRPFFIPDFASPCSLQGSIVVRINRLGRYIAPQFAQRYFDSITIGVAFTADNLFKQCQTLGLPWDVSKGFDGAAAIGQFLKISDLNGPLKDFKITLKDNGAIIQEANYQKANFSIDEIVSYISKFYMLRQGDLIYYGFPCSPSQATIDHKIEAFLNEKSLLHFNIK